MGKSIVVVGYGPAISTAVAERFGSAGFSVALVARNLQKLAAGLGALQAKGIEAAAFPADAGDASAVAAAIEKASGALEPIHVLHWNAAGGGEVGDLLAAEPASLRSLFDISLVGLIAAVRAALPELRKAGDGAVLITNGAFGDLQPSMDALAVQAKAMGLALSNGAKHKLVGLLAARLKAEGVYVGEVMVAGIVKGSGGDAGRGNVDPAAVADAFWGLYQARGEVRARVT